MCTCTAVVYYVPSQPVSNICLSGITHSVSDVCRGTSQHTCIVICSTHTHTCSTHTSKLFNVYTGIADLFTHWTLIQLYRYYVVNWLDLGLALAGIAIPYTAKDKQQKAWQSWWLHEGDAGSLAATTGHNVNQVGTPSWSVLQTALGNIGENKLADAITTQWWVEEYMFIV